MGRVKQAGGAPPLIGITSHRASDPDHAELDGLLAQIVAAVARAGGAPVLVPPGLAPTALRTIFDRLDGVLLSGGGDLDPACYGAAAGYSRGPHPLVAGVDPDRDAAELNLARWATEARKPLFGICRGLQVLNVALGGSLYADVAEHPGAVRHTYSPGLPTDLRPHTVQVAAGTRLAELLGAPVVAVNSLHHQACRALAPTLRASARAPDGLLEAAEVPGHPFALAVQWHPECLPEAPEMQRLFAALVGAAAEAHRTAVLMEQG
jgi:putative glutamine amidotransferase